MGNQHTRVWHLARRRRAAAGSARPQRRGSCARPRGARALPCLRRTGLPRRFAAHAWPRRAGKFGDRAARTSRSAPPAIIGAARARARAARTGRCDPPRRRRAEARGPLREALELARACGADAVTVRAHDELVAAGARPRRDPTESRSNLTASELRVARMAAEGMTNREIAQALFLTENTIETHLRSVFRKLEISSRSQLARSSCARAAIRFSRSSSLSLREAAARTRLDPGRNSPLVLSPGHKPQRRPDEPHENDAAEPPTVGALRPHRHGPRALGVSTCSEQRQDRLRLQRHRHQGLPDRLSHTHGRRRLQPPEGLRQARPAAFAAPATSVKAR